MKIQKIQYVIVIAWDRVQYGYIFRVLIFLFPYFPSPQARKITTKISERGKYIHIVRVTCDNYFIISTKNI